MSDSVSDSEYHQLLFHTAVLVMACDGEIHADELRELRLAHQTTRYFSGIDFDGEFARLRNQFEGDRHEAIQKYFQTLGDYEFDPVQQLQMLELVLRIVYADQRVDENEKRFCQMLLRVLRIPTAIIEKRFGSVPFLFVSSQDRKLEQTDLVSAIADQLAIPVVEDLKAIEG